MTPATESTIARQVREALAAMGIVCWRTQAGRTRVKGGWMHGANAGVPDVVGYMPGGRIILLEIKTAKGKERPAQTEWLARAKAAGCCVATVRSVDEAVAFVQAAKGRAIRSGPKEKR